MASKAKGDQKPAVVSLSGQFRAKLVWRGDAIVLGAQSNDTVGDVQSDYKALSWSLRELGQYVSQKRTRLQKADPTVVDIKRDFTSEHILLGDGTGPGYASDSDLEKFLKTNPAPGKFAKELVARAWNLDPSTIDTYIKPHRKKK